MFEINCKVIPHSEQRYPTVGDWWFEQVPIENSDLIKEVLQIRVSSMDNFEYEFLVMRHEQDEAILCRQRGIDEEQITQFDKMYEQRRETGDPEFQGECGDHPLAPYRKEHFFATTQERAMAAELGVDWSEYDKAVMEL